MAVCQYFLRGQCRFGSQCKNEHPGQPAGRGTQFGGSSWSNPNKVSLAFTQETIASDLTQHKDKPLWPLSCYAPAKGEPNVLSGLDESPEELRVRAHTARQAGNLSEYVTYETNKLAAAEQTFANALSNVSQVYQQAQRGSLANPNPTQTTTPSAFGAPAQSAFGAPATSAFGGSAFGNSARPAFGQSGFGQTAATPTFGQASTPSAFGQPTAFGQPAATSAFGQTSQPQSSLIKPASGAFSAFASMGTGSFGATAGGSGGSGGGGSGGGFSAFSGNNTTPFGSGATSAPAPSQTTGGSAFGQPSFGQSAFGNPTPPTQTSAFGTPATTSAFGSPATSTTAFGTPPTTTTSAFGTPPTTTAPAFGTPPANPTFGAPAFGAPTAFGQQAQQPPVTTTPAGAPPTSAFGGSAFAPVNTTAAPSAFGGGGTGSAFSSFASPFTQPQQKTVSAFAPVQQAPSGFGAPGPSNSGSAFGQPPQPAQNQRGNNNAPPNFVGVKSPYKPGSSPYDQALPQNYMEILPPNVLEAFKAEKFELGKIPEWIPPLQLR
ncbi:hypothetical protein BDN72DRAFT_840374 [Pluteus cervinus]|uniref:Uncharacterized protein n=1 Tax=Pluteus cervinus TaxID=181527 RepID=A0ACD3AVW4_9AGAR|nr:hypothetical protein BDN72DRAFT_840374 [Pluteus cervinus]